VRLFHDEIEYKLERSGDEKFGLHRAIGSSQLAVPLCASNLEVWPNKSARNVKKAE